MNCQQCGSDNKDEATFCCKCGANLYQTADTTNINQICRLTINNLTSKKEQWWEATSNGQVIGVSKKWKKETMFSAMGMDTKGDLERSNLMSEGNLELATSLAQQGWQISHSDGAWVLLMERKAKR